jgi:hypothetical protein
VYRESPRMSRARMRYRPEARRVRLWLSITACRQCRCPAQAEPRVGAREAACRARMLWVPRFARIRERDSVHRDGCRAARVAAGYRPVRCTRRARSHPLPLTTSMVARARSPRLLASRKTTSQMSRYPGLVSCAEAGSIDPVRLAPLRAQAFPREPVLRDGGAGIGRDARE